MNWLGDAVKTMPALQRLREALPAAHITLLTPAELADPWRHHPSVDAVMHFPDGEGLVSIARRLPALRFDTALVLPNSPRSAMQVCPGGIRRRVDYARPWRTWLRTVPVPPRPGEVPMRKRPLREIHRLCDAAPPPMPWSSAARHVLTSAA